MSPIGKNCFWRRIFLTERMVGIFYKAYPKQATLVEKVARKKKISANDLIRQLIDKLAS